MNTEEIYSKVDRLRKDKGITIYALSCEAGISHNTLYSWNKRKTMPSLETLEKICDALGTTLSRLMFNMESKELSEEQKHLMDLWSVLNREQKEAVSSMLKAMARQ
jgi:transcriptional regulator with XRE-family HTH domain